MMRRQRLYAALLGLGAILLLGRTVAMISEGALGVLVSWVLGLLFLEMVVDGATLLAALRWGASADPERASPALRLGAAAAVIHAVRVLIFVAGRVGPWIDFDVQPEERAFHGERWSWGEVYFAGALAVVGLIGVVSIWQMRRRRRG